jgi:hypothetical protein
MVIIWVKEVKYFIATPVDNACGDVRLSADKEQNTH